ncbi:MAG: ABC transporter permease [Anaerolineae bacterium]
MAHEPLVTPLTPTHPSRSGAIAGLAARIKPLYPPLAGSGLLILLWGLLSTLYPPLLLPSPVNVLEELASLAVSGELWQETATTIVRLSMAYACATMMGVGLGLLAGSRPTVAGLLRPPMGLAAAVPPIAWLALALIWFGTGSMVPIVVATLAATPAIYGATVAGMHTLDPDLTAAVKLYGLRGRVLLREYYLPALAPSLGGGMAMGASLVVRVGVMGEFLASASGIGSAMALARTQLDTARLLAWLVAALALATALDLVTRPLLGRLTRPREHA